MTDKLRAAAQAAIGAMVRAAITGHSDALDGYAEALRAALAEPTCKQDLQVAEQDAEPFLWYDDDTGDTWTPEAVVEGWAPTDLRPLYTAPPSRSWVPLTDEERKQFAQWVHPDVLERVEYRLKEKNT